MEATVPISKPIFSNQALARLLVPLVIEQLLLMTVGMADTMMVTTAGEAVKDLRLPAECVLISVTRRGELIIPRGPTKLQGGDQVLVLVGASATHQLMEALHLDENEEGEPEEAASHPQERQKWKIPWRKK